MDDKKRVEDAIKQVKRGLKTAVDVFGKQLSPIEAAAIIVAISPLINSAQVKATVPPAAFLTRFIAVRDRRTVGWKEGKAFSVVVSQSERNKILDELLESMLEAKKKHPSVVGMFDEVLLDLGIKHGFEEKVKEIRSYMSLGQPPELPVA